MVAGNLRMGKEEVDADDDMLPDGVAQIDDSTPEGKDRLKRQRTRGGKFVLRPRKEKSMF